MKFGDKIRELRLTRGETLAQVAAASGVNQSWISDCEHGRSGPPPIERTLALARALDADASELMALAAIERGQMERPPDVGDADWAELVERWASELDQRRQSDS